MLRLKLEDDDVTAVEAVVDELLARFESVEVEEFQAIARVYAEELPRRLRAVLHEFRDREPAGAIVVSGFPIRQDAIGPTPEHWRRPHAPSPTAREDIAFYLIASVLGEPIAWATQQEGRIMHDVAPIKGHEHEQIGSGSAEVLVWHTEDAYHPLRTDYLGLLCLRNPDGVETTMLDVSDVELDEGTVSALREERFFILPDHSHRGAPTDEADPKVAALRARSHAQVERALSDPDPVAVLFGAEDSPYLRLDPHFMAPNHEPEQQRALDAVCAAIDACMSGAVLSPGDMIFIDNYRVVHGRKPFRARFDGADRWLRRLNVTRDLRKSRANRLSAGSRVIY